MNIYTYRNRLWNDVPSFPTIYECTRSPIFSACSSCPGKWILWDFPRRHTRQNVCMERSWGTTLTYSYKIGRWRDLICANLRCHSSVVSVLVISITCSGGTCKAGSESMYFFDSESQFPFPISNAFYSRMWLTGARPHCGTIPLSARLSLRPDCIPN